ncbi:MAG: zinc-binding dehydrogenase [Rhodospirillales bacterium]|jgi:alcohol dehydrogenase|nr:zinc-binding dehydrogenase [Rhodospirillales bacterium]MDP6772705.1 zinc-binding dehydrogenase [Rhodospirillales bacterium]
MKAVFFKEHGDISKLEYGEFPEPEVKPGWVKIKVGATSLNWLDISTRRGMPGIRTELPGITGGDCAGEISEIGADVSGWEVGQRVLLRPGYFSPEENVFDMMGETRPGALAEYCTVRAKQLTALPDDVSDEDASCLPIAYGTAHRMLFTRGQVQAGEKVLILGASGGVGTACVMLCKIAGAHVIAAASTDEKCRRLEKLGADETINYTDVDFVKHIRETTGSLMRGGGCDVVINYSGGDSWAKSLRCVKRNGRLLTCGATAGFEPTTDIRFIWTAEMNIIGSNGWTLEDQETLVTMVRDGRLKPVIDKVMRLDEGIEACRMLEERRFFGKIVVKP